MSSIDFGDGRPVVTIDMNAKCLECGKGGAVPNGLCLKCTTKAIAGKPMRSVQGRAVQERFRKEMPTRPRR